MQTETQTQPHAHVLVVDDERDVVSYCERALARSGYTVSSAYDPYEALRLLESTRVDLLITDLRMPGMSGLELLTAARAHQPDLDAVVITGYADTIEVALRALRSGARDLVAKPFTIPELSQAVSHALEQTRLAREHSRLATLMPLLDLSLRGVTAHNMALLLEEGLTIICEALGADMACFYRWDADGEELVFGHQHGQGQAPIPEPAKLAELVLAADGASILPDGASAVGSAMALSPARAPGALVGAVLAQRSQTPVAFSESDLEILTIMSNQIAAIYENCRLVHELETWNQRLERRVQEATQEVQQAQERALRTERLAAIGQLGSSIAHELRNPLGVISNSVYYLRSRLGNDDPKIARHLEIIESEVAVSNDIITDLMSFARVRQLDTRPVDPAALLRAALERITIPPSVTVELHAAPTEPQVYADSDRLLEVLLNLISNAIQAMPDGGHLSLEIGADDGHVLFHVADTGIGIPPDQTETIFEPLVTTKPRGIGLGLSIVRMLVEAHQGSIHVDSTPGQGSRFTVRIPRVIEEAPQ